MKKLIFVLFMSTAAGLAMAQEFVITAVETQGGDINIHYTLADTVPHRAYTISLYSSKDNFVSTLEKVSGDIGLEVKPGEKKKITWRAKEELGAAFEGKIALEVRGKLYVPFVRLDGHYSVMKRNKNYEMTWTGGTAQNILNFDLYRDGEKITAFTNIANVGHCTIRLPGGVKPRKGYSFRITDSKNKDQVVNTPPFAVKRKVPLLVKVVPMAAAGYLASVLAAGSGSAAASIPAAPGHP